MTSTEYEKEKNNKVDEFSRVIDSLVERKQRILDGKTNCIPLSFERFRRFFPGTEMGKYIIITAMQKIGKTKLTDKLFIYDSFFYAIEHPDQLKFKALYFTLEESKEIKIASFYSYLLYKLDKVRISVADLRSTDSFKPCPKEVLELLESDRYQRYIKEFKKMVHYIDDVKNPTGINKYCRAYALDNGTLHMKKEYRKVNNAFEVENDISKPDMVLTDVPDFYEADNPDEYRFIILDNFSNLSSEKGMSKHQTIEKMSKYFNTLRDQLNYTIIAVQHQAQDKEGLESKKFGALEPSSDGLGDCKLTARDVNMLIGLYSPFKYGIKSYAGYSIEAFQNNIRFLNVIEDREYNSAGNICPLFFDGAVSEFIELPTPDEEYEINKFLNLKRLMDEGVLYLKEEPKSTLFFSKGLKKSNIINKLKFYGKNCRNFWRKWCR